MLGTISKTAFKAAYILKKHAPEILTAVSVVTSVGAVIKTAQEAPKASKIIEEHRKALEDIHTVVAGVKEGEDFEYNPDDEKKDLTRTYISTGTKLAKVFAPAIILESVSIASALCGTYIARMEIKKLVATAATLQSLYSVYRDNVVAKYGIDADEEMRTGLKDHIKTVTIKNEDGSETKAKEVIKAKKPNHNMMTYTILWDEVNADNWTNDPFVNKSTIDATMGFIEREVRRKGFVFCDTIEDKLSVRMTKAGHNLGIYEHPHETYNVSYRYVDGYGKENKSFINGLDPSTYIEIQIDGFIEDKIGSFVGA